jgi:hypothetical protein
MRSLDGGAMMTIAFTMSREERLAVASFLGTPDTVSGPPPAAFCTDRTVRLAATPAVSWNGWSPGTGNARFQPATAAGVSAAQVPALKLKWAFGFDGDVSAFSQPTVLDGHLFVGSAAGLVHAMRADTGCLEWTFQANGPVRAAIVAAPLNGRQVLLFGDMTGWFYALNAETGASISSRTHSPAVSNSARRARTRTATRSISRAGRLYAAARIAATSKTSRGGTRARVPQSDRDAELSYADDTRAGRVRQALRRHAQ